MVIMNRVAPPVASQVLPAAVVEGLMAIVAGAKAIEAWLVNSNTGSNPIGGILIPSSSIPEMPPGDCRSGCFLNALYTRERLQREESYHLLTVNFFTALSSPSIVRLYMGKILLIRLTVAGCWVRS